MSLALNDALAEPIIDRDPGDEDEVEFGPAPAKKDASRPMSYAGIHYWFKRALKVAEIDESVMMHEMRHSAADNLYRETGDIGKAQQLLRHKSPATTAGYLHPSMDDLAEALRSLEE